MKSKAEPLSPVAASAVSGSDSSKKKEEATYSGYVLKKDKMMVDVSVFFNFADKTYTLSDFDYILVDETVKAYDKTGKMFASFFVPQRVREYL